MASVEDIKQELAKAEDKEQKAETALETFKEDDNRGKWLDELNGKQRRRERLDEDEREKLKELAAEKKQLEADKRERLKQVEEWGAKLREMTSASQPGNDDFVTRRWDILG